MGFMRVRFTAAAVILVLMTGCAVIDEFADRLPAVVSHLEVFNRTEADLFYVAADGERLDVPACGNASDPSFRIDNVRVRTADGYIRGFGVGAPEFAGRHLVLVEVADSMAAGIPLREPPPHPLPPCEGLPDVQVGV